MASNNIYDKLSIICIVLVVFYDWWNNLTDKLNTRIFVQPLSCKNMSKERDPLLRAFSLCFCDRTQDSYYH